jgi:hypothetical protein
MEGNKDEKSQGHLIEGKGLPIEGGVFRRTGHPGIVVDESKLQDLPWYPDEEDMIQKTKASLLGLVVEALTPKLYLQHF